ncbi:MAG: restriction endonuclease subunit S, partial [Pirellula sp.]
MTPETFIEHFETFAEAPNGVAKLRELILQLAVQGKLGTQDVNDEPASVLLRRIDDAKSRLAKLGRLKSPSQFPPVDERESPDGWAVVRLGSFIELISGQHLTPEEYNEAGEGHPYLTGPADFGERHPVATRWTHADRALARRDDILITVKGAGIGKSNLVATETAFISRQLMAVRPIIVDRDFVHLALRSGYDQFQRQGVGIAIPGIGRDDILHFVVALPPLAEQRRIVGKVDQLLGLCDE